ncbi:MAG: glutaredoxin domain-containing protein, partial [Gaiellaceae bacterium]
MSDGRVEGIYIAAEKGELPHSVERVGALAGKGLDFTEIDVSQDRGLREEMISRANGVRTVPQIFIHGRHVGGYDELAQLERE